MCFAQGHNAVTLVKLEPAALGLESSHFTSPILLLQREGQALPNAREGIYSIQSIKPAPGSEVITSFSAQLN